MFDTLRAPETCAIHRSFSGRYATTRTQRADALTHTHTGLHCLHVVIVRGLYRRAWARIETCRTSCHGYGLRLGEAANAFLLGCAVSFPGRWRRGGGPGAWHNTSVIARATAADSDHTLEVSRSAQGSRAGIWPAGEIGVGRSLGIVLMGPTSPAARCLKCSWYLSTQSTSLGSARGSSAFILPSEEDPV